MPIAATTQSVAAVVRPRIDRPWRMIAPAPRKPIPVTICAAIRVGSARTTLWPEVRNSWNPYADTIVNSAEPTDTSMCVRNHASRSRISRSTPIAPPSTAASTSRRSASVQSSVGMLCAKSSNGLFLRGAELLDPSGSELEQLVELLACERRPLRRRLHLDQLGGIRHHDVHVHLGLRVLGVVEIEERLALDNPHGDRGDRAAQRAAETEALERTTCGDVRARDRSAARAAVRLKDVAVDPERPLAEGLEVGHRPQRAADQPLDLDRAPTLLPARRLALRAVARRRRQQRVLRRQPTAPLAVEPARDALLHRRGAEHLRLPLRQQDRAVRLLEEVRLQIEPAQLVRTASVGAHQTAAAASSASSTCSTSAIGSCRNRAPIARNASGSPVVRNRYVPSRAASFSKPLRSSVSDTSRAVSSAEKTSVTSRPNTRWKIGRISG